MAIPVPNARTIAARREALTVLADSPDGCTRSEMSRRGFGPAVLNHLLIEAARDRACGHRGARRHSDPDPPDDHPGRLAGNWRRATPVAARVSLSVRRQPGDVLLVEKAANLCINFRHLGVGKSAVLAAGDCHKHVADTGVVQRPVQADILRVGNGRVSVSDRKSVV